MDASYLMGTVFSGLSALVVEDVRDGGDAVVVTARTRDVDVPCPVCGIPTAKVHGYHRRSLADVPVDGRPVVVRLRVRRLVCQVLGCRRQTFREQIPSAVSLRLLSQFCRNVWRVLTAWGPGLVSQLSAVSTWILFPRRVKEKAWMP